jgi:tetratricopeptide (TPR) repeat protein
LKFEVFTSLPPQPKALTSASVLLVLLVAAVYFPVVGFDFTNYDDPDYVTHNNPVRAGVTFEGIKWAFTHAHSANWHPLTWISHMVDCQVYGLNAGGHHLTNVLLHTANSLLLLLVLYRLTGAAWRSALVAVLFALHPAHVESVAWVAERKDVLSACFFLLTLLAYIRYARERGAPRAEPMKEHSGFKWYVLALLLFALGLMSKPMLVTLPLVLLLLDYWNAKSGTRGAGSSARTLVLEKVPFFALAAASCVVTVLVQRASDALAPLGQSPLHARLTNAPISYFRYIGELLWPARLAVLYPEVEHWPGWEVALSAAVLVGCTFLALRWWKQRPWFFVGWAWFLVMLIPVIGLVKVGSHSIADRYTYLPSIGFFVIVAWGGAELFGGLQNRGLAGRARPALRVGFAVVLPSVVAVLGCAFLTRAQVFYWQNSETLFRHALAVTTNNYVAYTSLAFDLADHHQLHQAEECLREALRIEPTYEQGWTKLASVHTQARRYEEAEHDSRKALQLNPASPAAHGALGFALMKLSQTNAAVAEYREALRLNPQFGDAHYNLANFLAQQGQYAEAKTHYAAAARSEPDSADAHNNLAYMLVREGKLDEAIAEFKAALRLRPDSWRARYGLGQALLRVGRVAEGIEQLALVVKSQPALRSAWIELGAALEKQGRPEQAADVFREAAARNPEFAAAHYHLALVLSRQGLTEGAIQEAQEGRRIAEKEQTELLKECDRFLAFLKNSKRSAPQR